jgi:hypothetical protein
MRLFIMAALAGKEDLNGALWGAAAAGKNRGSSNYRANARNSRGDIAT